jgi:hypothetical protein
MYIARIHVLYISCAPHIFALSVLQVASLFYDFVDVHNDNELNKVIHPKLLRPFQAFSKTESSQCTLYACSCSGI